MLRQQALAAKRLIAAKKAKDSLVDFARFMMPDPNAPDDPDQSRYMVARHHRVIAAALEEVDKGTMQRLIVTMPPRAGKSQLVSRLFPAWILGRDPYKHMILATYNDTFACDFGRDVRGIMQSDSYKQVFGEVLRRGNASADRLQTKDGGMGVFVGAGGSITGRGADFLLLDDVIKGREDADSPAQREKLWGWFLDVAMTRLMDVGARVCIVMTRWHEDDIVGRLIDPENPCYIKEEAAKWKVLNLPALAERDDPLGREEGESIWPERFTREYYEEARRQNPRGFSALYQGRPAPEDGDFFKKEWIQGYTRDELPQRLRYYCASDHAVTANQERDPTCLIPVGICERNHIWVLPDVWWRHAETDTVVDAMLGMIQRYRPLKWWAERGHVSKAIGPFLRKRMQEEEAYCAIDEVVPSADKQTRAQSIQGRMAMGMVHLPKFAGWYQKAVNEILKFPNGRHDDFVDTLSLIGLGLQSLIGAGAPVKKKSAPKTGTLAWVKESSKREARRKMIRLNSIE